MTTPHKIAIHFPSHVQQWTVTPHGGELAGTARRIPDAPKPGQEAKSPDPATRYDIAATRRTETRRIL